MEAFPWRDTGTGKAGAAGSRAVAASVQVAHTKRTSSLVWHHMIKIFSPLPLPEAIYCFSTTSALGQRARRSSRPRDAPALTGAAGNVFVSGDGPLCALAALGTRFALPSHLGSSTVWSISSISSGTSFTLKIFAS